MDFDLIKPLLHREILSPLYINMELHRRKSKGPMTNYPLKVTPASLAKYFYTSGRKWQSWGVTLPCCMSVCSPAPEEHLVSHFHMSKYKSAGWEPIPSFLPSLLICLEERQLQHQLFLHEEQAEIFFSREWEAAG